MAAASAVDVLVSLKQKQDELNSLVSQEIQKLKEERKALEEEKAAWKEAANKLNKAVVSGRIRLDVGGTMFATTISTLTRISNTFFAAMFGGRFALKPEEDGSFFIDRDPFVFRHVLNFLRGEQVKPEQLSQVEREALQRDGEFYQIGELVDLVELRAPAKPLVPAFIAKFTAGGNYTLSADNTIATHSTALAWDNVVLGHALPRDVPVFRFRFTITNDGGNGLMMLGVAPSTVDRAASSVFSNCGWYLYAHDSTLYSGPPINKSNEAYRNGGRIGTGSTVDVEVDRTQRTISFVINGESCGVAYRDVFASTDELCPCASIYQANAAVCISTFPQ